MTRKVSKPKVAYTQITTGDWIWFGVATLAIIVAYSYKPTRPLVILIVIIVVVGIMLRFEPAIAEQLNGIKGSV